MCGEQLVASRERYTAEAINQLPAELKERITVRSIDKAGRLVDEKITAREQLKKVVEKANKRQVRENKAREKERQKKRKQKAQNATSDDDDSDESDSDSDPDPIAAWEAIAMAASIEADEEWRHPKVIQREKDLDRLTTQAFWKDINVDDGFHDHIKIGLPGLWNDDSMSAYRDEWEKHRKPNKTKIMALVTKYIATVKEMADMPGEVENTLSDDDISDMNRNDLLELFLMVDDVSNLTEVQKHTKAYETAARAYMGTAGNDIADVYLRLGPDDDVIEESGYESDNEGDGEDDGDDDGDTE